MSDQPALEPADMAKIPFLSGLEPAEVEALCAAASLRQCGENELVFRAGDSGQELFVIIDGEVAIELEVVGAPSRVVAFIAEQVLNLPRHLFSEAVGGAARRAAASKA